MYALANARVSILGGTTEDSWGDQVDASALLATNVPARIDERAKKVNDPGSDEQRTIRHFTAVLPADKAWVTDDHRVRDDTRGGRVFAIRSVTQNSSSFHRPDVVVELVATN